MLGAWPAGTAALHLNAGVARTVDLYRQVTGDASVEGDCGSSAVVEGFGGLRQHPGVLALAPRLPAGITRPRFRIRHSGLRLRVDADHETVWLRQRDGSDARLPAPLSGERVDVSPDEPVVRAVAPPRAAAARASAARRTSPRLTASPRHDTSGDVT